MGYTGGVIPPSPEEAEIYGRDLYFDGNLTVTGAGDYATVDGVENLRRAILRRLMVRPGEYRLRPDYGVGVPLYVKKRLTDSVRSELRDRIVTQLQRDPRVEKVLEVSVSSVTVGDTPYLRILVRVQARGKRVEFAPFLFSQKV